MNLPNGLLFISINSLFPRIKKLKLNLFFKIRNLHKFIHEVFGNVLQDTILFKNDFILVLKIDDLVDKARWAGDDDSRAGFFL